MRENNEQKWKKRKKNEKLEKNEKRKKWINEKRKKWKPEKNEKRIKWKKGKNEKRKKFKNGKNRKKWKPEKNRKKMKSGKNIFDLWCNPVFCMFEKSESHNSNFVNFFSDIISDHEHKKNFANNHVNIESVVRIHHVNSFESGRRNDTAGRRNLKRKTDYRKPIDIRVIILKLKFQRNFNTKKIQKNLHQKISFKILQKIPQKIYRQIS